MTHNLPVIRNGLFFAGMLISVYPHVPELMFNDTTRISVKTKGPVTPIKSERDSEFFPLALQLLKLLKGVISGLRKHYHHFILNKPTY